MTPADPIRVAEEVIAVLDGLKIKYVIGGSVAASLFGEPRSTLDLDVMIDCDPDRARLLAKRLSDTCYVDEATAVEAAARRGSFNAIHLATSLKIDFFFAEDSPFARAALTNRRRVFVGNTDLYFYAPEDLIVRKLMWYRSGNETSLRQWRDVIGILKVNRADLDMRHLLDAATDAGVADLLEKAAAASTTPDSRPSP